MPSGDLRHLDATFTANVQNEQPGLRNQTGAARAPDWKCGGWRQLIRGGGFRTSSDRLRQQPEALEHAGCPRTGPSHDCELASAADPAVVDASLDERFHTSRVSGNFRHLAAAAIASCTRRRSSRLSAQDRRTAPASSASASNNTLLGGVPMLKVAAFGAEALTSAIEPGRSSLVLGTSWPGGALAAMRAVEAAVCEKSRGAGGAGGGPRTAAASRAPCHRKVRGGGLAGGGAATA
eukprot:CAMPEP_0170265216 /NCGR_PEP_ID=MMETSP0116_2-20130129/32513_1 /TAXON_ID=400756 /ORGANISM="Durinskia baltica, Strain CSIRO CS-38" /LENGTH=235 /DNA_ID=CAMNT_0010516329 /DNA_START=425 /DNA_END=1129 /DNA_ORIENTATION=+